MDEVVLDGKTYIGSKKAALECGYTQDYVGQLSRAGHIDAKRVSGQWYVQIDSLKAYKTKADTFKPEPPKYSPDPSVESSIQVEGKEFVSAALAAKLAQYNQDYVGQLARAGKIPSKQIGNRWYVERVALLKHKDEKDAMLRAVQAEAVGLKKVVPQIGTGNMYSLQHRPDPALMIYAHDEKPLFPVFKELIEEQALKAAPEPEEPAPVPQVGSYSRIPIRVVKQKVQMIRGDIEVKQQPVALVKKIVIPRKSIFQGIFWQGTAAVAAVVLVVFIGVRVPAIYAALKPASTPTPAQAQTASSGSVIDSIGNALEKALVPELTFVRS